MGIATSPGGSTPPAAESLRLEITLEKQTGVGWTAVDPGLVFESDDRVRFRITPNFGGFLYVMNHGTSGDYTLLFPREETGLDNKIERDQEYVVPATSGAFRIAGPPGHEIVYWVVSPVELQSKDAGPPYHPLPPPPAPGKTPPNLLPRCDDTILRARGDCIDTSAGLRPVEEPDALPENLSGLRHLQSRQLLFMKKDNKAVVGAGEAGGPVIFEFRLAHK
jgi:hypothetical protein